MVDRIQTGTGVDNNETVVREGAVAQGDAAFKEPRDPNAPVDNENPGVNQQATDATSTGEAPDPIQTRRTAFEAEQESRRKAFERDSNAEIARMERAKQFDTEKAERDKKLNARRQELLERSFEDGLLTHGDLERQRALLAPHTQQGVMAPHEALGQNEDSVLMAFPRAVTLTMSANDIKRMNNLDENEPSVTGSISHGARVHFAQGYNDVPVGLADHAYLHSAGAYRVGDDGKPESADARHARLKQQHDDKDRNKRDHVKAEVNQIDKDAAQL